MYLMMNTLSVKFKELEVPRILLGTSPFLAAGQFGLRAWEYYRKFVGKSENVAKIIKCCVALGVKGVQVLAYDYIVEAIESVVRETGEKLFIVGTVMPEDPRRSIKLLENIDCKIDLVHGALTSARRLGMVGEHLRLIKDAGMIPGIALHDIPVLEEVLQKFPDVEVVMAPINVEGEFMRDRDRCLRILEKSGRFIIAKKALGAGRIEPRRALEYVYSLPFVKSVAVGVASEEEAKETFTIAREILEKT